MRVYFDNSATTKPAEEVLAAMMEVLRTYYGNPSSIHHLGVEAERLIHRSREVIGGCLHIDPSEVIFTSGGTESNNLAIQGVAKGYSNRGKHMITSEVEHASVYELLQELAQSSGFEITKLPVNQHGIISAEDVQKAIRKDTILVSLMHVNNELGSIQPIAEVGAIVAQYPSCYFHVDYVQGYGKIPLSIRESHIDFLSLSGHKIHAPKGIGMLYVRKGIRLPALQYGGAQEQGVRPGTENVAGIVALAKAMRLTQSTQRADQAHMSGLKKRMIQQLERLEFATVNTPLDDRLSAPHIVNVSFPSIKPEVLVHALEEKGIYVSTKSACSSRSSQESRILTACGLREEVTRSAIRISFSAQSTLEEVDYFIQVIQEVVPQLKEMMRL